MTMVVSRWGLAGTGSLSFVLRAMSLLPWTRQRDLCILIQRALSGLILVDGTGCRFLWHPCQHIHILLRTQR